MSSVVEPSVTHETPSHYLDQIKQAVECDRRVHALISLYEELEKRVEVVEHKVKNL